MKAIILCGGMGTRMGKSSLYLPKVLTKIAGKTILEHQLEAFKKEGITDFIFVTGYLHEKITEYFFTINIPDINVSFFKEETPLGTAGALFKLNLTEDFILCNGDLIFDIDIKSMYCFHKEKKALATLFTHPNTHPYDSVLLKAENDGKISALFSKDDKKDTCRNLCNAGIEIVSPELLKLYNINGKADFDRDLIAPAIKSGRIFSYKSTEYVHDMGTPQRKEKVEADVLSDNPSKKRLNNRQRAIFLDRDGTINIHKGFIINEDEIELTQGAAEAISSFNKAGYLVIIITNQPVIARGECTTNTLEKIHGRLESLLGESGAFIDDIFYCPHHPDSGFKGEIKELKIKCSCRKPAPEMLLSAQKKYNIDMSESYMVGDSLTDIQAAKNAGCMPVFLAENKAADCLTFKNLKEFSDFIFTNKNN